MVGSFFVELRDELDRRAFHAVLAGVLLASDVNDVRGVFLASLSKCVNVASRDVIKAS